MKNMTLLILLLPLFSSLFCLSFGYKIGRVGSVYLSIASIVLTAILAIVLFWKVAINHNVITTTLFSWFSNELFLLEWVFLFDPLSVTMLIVVTIISALVHVYSTSYMMDDPQLPRFLAYLSLFTFFMLILVTASNFLQLFMGWEGVGLCSYLLISFWYTRISAGKAALKAIVLNRIGDCGLLLAIFAIFLSYRSLDFSVIFSVTPFLSNNTIIFWGYEVNILNFISFFLVVAAIGKSAQIGLHTWLPDAMEGPTPVSALIHAATMVTAGVFLIIRCSPIFEYTPSILLLMSVVGSLTSIFAATAAIVQHDIKKTVAYSTCSQLGYMVFCCGLSNYPTSLYHLVNHAFFKALLFLSAGAVIHALLNEQDIRKMGGLAKLLPFTFIVMLIGSLALCGFPFLAGFYSKDIILETTIQTTGYFQYFIVYTSFMTAFLTSIYSFRTLYLVFLAPISVYKTTSKQIHEVPVVMASTLVVLAVGSIFSGYFFFDMFAGLGTDFFENSIFVRDVNANIWISIECLTPIFKQLAPLFGLGGIVISIYLLKYKPMLLIRLKSFSNYYLYKFLINKWYFDNINNFLSKALYNFNYYNFYKLLDKGIFEFFGPRGIIFSVSHIANIFARTQSGYIWHYMCLMALFLFGFFFFYITNSNIVAISMLAICVAVKKKQSLKNKYYFSTMQKDSQVNFPPISNTPPQTAFSTFISLLGGLLVSFVFKNNAMVSLELIAGILLISILAAGIYHLYYQNYYIIKNFLDSFKTIGLSEKTFWSRLYVKNYFFLFFARVVIVHFFFYTTYGKILKQLLIFFTVSVSMLHSTSKDFFLVFVICSITWLLVTSFISLTFLFYAEKNKKTPYLYSHVDKQKVLSLVENGPGASAFSRSVRQIVEHVGGPATIAALLGGTIHAWRDISMNHDNNQTQIKISQAQNETALKVAEKNIEVVDKQQKVAEINRQTEVERNKRWFY